jgi:RNase P subunit RPR2
MTWFSKLRNNKYFKSMEDLTKKSNELYNKKFQTVVCVYCGQLLPKNEAAVVFDIEKGENEYSHEECWNANNIVSDKPPIPKNK